MTAGGGPNPKVGPGRLDPPVRAVIVDDEALARDGIRLRLEGTPDFAVVGEFADTESALAALPNVTPDVLFVDVQMRGASGLELMDRLGVAAVPAVVFVTAYDEYALDAFTVRALDYLVKPYDDERFEETLERVRARIAETRDSALGRHVRTVVTHAVPALPGSAPRGADRIVVRNRDAVTFVRTETIDWVEAARDYVRLHVGREAHLIRETLSGVYGKLDPARFVQIHRSAIVNLDRIAELQPFFHGEYVAILNNGSRLKVGRRWRDGLARALGTRL